MFFIKICLGNATERRALNRLRNAFDIEQSDEDNDDDDDDDDDDEDLEEWLNNSSSR